MRTKNGRYVYAEDGNDAGSLKPLEDFIRSRATNALQFAYRLSGNLEESRELVQETCYRVLWHWAHYDPRQSLDGWFFTILRNVFRDSRRDSERHLSLDHPMANVDGVHLSHADLFADGNSDVLEHLEKEEAGANVRHALRRIRPFHRKVLKLRALDRCSYAEIAHVEDIPVGTVRSRLFRARKTVQKRLDQMAVAS